MIYYLNKSWQLCKKFDIQEKKIQLDNILPQLVLELELAVNMIAWKIKIHVYVMCLHNWEGGGVNVVCG